MSKRENCEHRHTTNGNCLFNGGFCLANDEEHCVRINEIKSYNQALEDIKKFILNSCNNVTCREDISIDNDFDFYASELLDMLEEMKK